MDIHKLEVDDSQINKATGRIILPDKETPGQHRPHPAHPRPAAPRITARPSVASAPASAHVPAHGQTPAPMQTSLPPMAPAGASVAANDSVRNIPAASWWSVLAVGVLLTLGVFLLGSIWWSHGQLSQSLEALRMESIRGQAQIEKTGQALHDANRDLSDLRVVLSEMRSEVRADLQSQTNRLRNLQEQMAELEMEPVFIAPPQMTSPAPVPMFPAPVSSPNMDNSMAP